MSTIKQQAESARRAGQTTFIADKPCKRGHRERHSHDGNCAECKARSDRMMRIKRSGGSTVAPTLPPGDWEI